MEKATIEALLFQTIDTHLKKKVLAEYIGLEDMVKTGLAHEHTQLKSDQMAGVKNKGEESTVGKMVIGDVKRLNLVPKTGSKTKATKC